MKNSISWHKEYLKIVKDSSNSKKDWWDDLSVAQKEGGERDLEDIKNGLTISHDEVRNKIMG